MAPQVQPIPPGYHTVSPHLAVRGGVRAMEVPGWDERGWRIRLNERGYKVLPSVVSSRGDGRFVVGQAAASLILTGIHAYLGVHVVERGVIFVDLSLAQIAALGTTMAYLAGHGLHEGKTGITPHLASVGG